MKITAFPAKQNGENIRIESETDRTAAERDRKEAEITRRKSEELRTAGEDIRKSNEELRTRKEHERICSENNRTDNEETRLDNEELRKADETERLENEFIRTASEDERVNSEKLRVCAEKVREAFEGFRKSNEMDREDAEALRKMRIDAAIEDAETAKERADKAALACENIVIGYGFIPVADKGSPNGVATLNKNGLVPACQLPGYIDDVCEGVATGVTANETGAFTAAGFIPAGETEECAPSESTIYFDTISNVQYRWTGSMFITTGTGLSLGETSGTAYYGDKGKTAYEHSQLLHARADATKTESSDINGNLKINESEITVYTHPDSHPAAAIDQDSEHRFVTDSEKEAWNSVKEDVETTVRKELDKINDTLENIGTFIAAPAAPEKTNILWIDTSAGGVMKYFNGTSWVPTKAVWG